MYDVMGNSHLLRYSTNLIIALFAGVPQVPSATLILVIPTMLSEVERRGSGSDRSVGFERFWICGRGELEGGERKDWPTRPVYAKGQWRREHKRPWAEGTTKGPEGTFSRGSLR